MTQAIKIVEKVVYGRVLLYPACETAKKFADLLQVKTFSEAQIRQIHGLGYDIDCQKLPV